MVTRSGAAEMPHTASQALDAALSRMQAGGCPVEPYGELLLRGRMRDLHVWRRYRSVRRNGWGWFEDVCRCGRIYDRKKASCCSDCG